jgi:hypothetical protein
VSKRLAISGDRTWTRGLIGTKISDPQPFVKMPLKYELAFGGTDLEPKNPDAPDYEPRNPIGVGLAPKGSKGSLEGKPLPNIEDPEHLIKGAGDRPAPAGLGPICPHWAPRKNYAGTYDEAWTKNRAPYLPKDFDPRFLNSAHPDLIAPSYLEGGEPVEMSGVLPRGAQLSFELPMCDIEIVFELDGKQHTKRPVLDTIVFEPDANRFSMIWRACQVVDKKLLRLSEMFVSCEQYPKRMVA